MLHAAHLHWAPKADRVSISTWGGEMRGSSLTFCCSWRSIILWDVCVRLCFVFLLTAVWAVMWVQPTTLAPARGFSPWARFLRAMRAGISDGGGNTTNNTWAERGISWMVKEFPSFNPSNTSSLIHRLVQLKKSLMQSGVCVCVCFACRVQLRLFVYESCVLMF